MKIKLEIEVKPFGVPNFVIKKLPPRLKQEGFNTETSESIPLSMLNKATLDLLVDEWVNAVYKKAGINQD